MTTSGGPRVPLLYRVARDRTAQSSTIAVVLLLAITVAGTGAVVTFGSEAMGDTQESSEIRRAEHAMTLFDSRAAMVALGETGSQSVTLGPSGGGSYSIEEDAGWLRIKHVNYTDTVSDDQNDEVLYNASLGLVRYEQGDTSVVYQGGGVWRSDGGGSTMVSPPEFHYRDATLTLPVIRVAGSGGAAGGTTAHVWRERVTRRAFPNATTGADDGPGAPYDETDRPYVNPVRNGTVRVTVQSQFYEGWADYFRERTEGEVSVDHDARTATVELVTAGQVGRFRMPERTNSVTVRGMDQGHSMQEFNVTLAEGNNFNNLYFSFWAQKGPQEFEILVHIPKFKQQECKDGDVDETTPLEMDVYYSDGTSGTREMWTNGSVPIASGPVRMQCGASGPELVANFTGDTEMTFGSATTSNEPSKWHHDWEGTAATQATFDHEGEDGETFTVDAGETNTSRLLVRHYFAELGPTVDLTVNYGPGGSPRVNTDGSYGTIEYVPGDGSEYITYLHVTENEVRVEVE